METIKLVVRVCSVLVLCYGSHVIGQPNFIVIMADDLGYESIGVNGGESYATPHLDRLAEEGMRFTNGFAQPLCTPSRVKIMTGQYNIRNYTQFGVLDRSQTTFAHQLKAAGYATAIVGKWQLGRQADAPQHFGFDEALLWQHTAPSRINTHPDLQGQGIDSRYPNPELVLNGETIYYTGGEYGPQVCADFIKNFIRENKDGPFLVYYPMILTHTPFIPTPDSDLWDPANPGSTTYQGDVGDRQENFGDMVTYMDKIIGQLDSTLDSLGIRDNTLMLFTGDNGNDSPILTQWNGIEVEWGKRKMQDNGIRVPFIASWPAVIEPGTVTDELVEFSDVLPTLVQAAGAELPEDYSNDGRSFLSTLAGIPGRQKDYIHIWFDGNEQLVRDKQYRWYYNIETGEYQFFDDGDLYRSVELDTTDLTPEQQTAWEALKAAMIEVQEAADSGTPLPEDTSTVTGVHDKRKRYIPGKGVKVYRDRVGRAVIQLPGVISGSVLMMVYSSRGQVLYKKLKNIYPAPDQKSASVYWDVKDNIGQAVPPGNYVITVNLLNRGIENLEQYEYNGLINVN